MSTMSLEDIAARDARFNVGALRFVYEGLSYTARKVADEPRHVSGQTLCDGLRQLAVEKWGRLAMMVLDQWGVRRTRDFGEIVYLLIEHQWMSAQPSDTIEHFDDVFDFQSVFKDRFAF